MNLVDQCPSVLQAHLVSAPFGESSLILRSMTSRVQRLLCRGKRIQRQDSRRATLAPENLHVTEVSPVIEHQFDLWAHTPSRAVGKFPGPFRATGSRKSRSNMESWVKR